jgi:glyoxylase-like metal-dependent hydrolase (beta-lactamase superfamily II)
VKQLRPGLVRWTARHPGWEPDAEPESPADWPEEVGCVAYEAHDAFVLVDPLVPDELWEPLEARVRRHGRRVVVLTTIPWHRRSRDAVVARLGASTSRARRNLPEGVETIPIPRGGETMVWLPEHGALVPGDRLLGDGSGGLRLCPESWLRYLDGGMTLDGLRAALEPLLDLPIELVLVSHGEPVLEHGREALARALDQR